MHYFSRRDNVVLVVLPRTTKFIQVTNNKNTVGKSKYDIRDEFPNFPTRFNLENCKCK